MQWWNSSKVLWEQSELSCWNYVQLWKKRVIFQIFRWIFRSYLPPLNPTFRSFNAKTMRPFIKKNRFEWFEWLKRTSSGLALPQRLTFAKKLQTNEHSNNTCIFSCYKSVYTWRLMLTTDSDVWCCGFDTFSPGLMARNAEQCQTADESCARRSVHVLCHSISELTKISRRTIIKLLAINRGPCGATVWFRRCQFVYSNINAVRCKRNAHTHTHTRSGMCH